MNLDFVLLSLLIIPLITTLIFMIGEYLKWWDKLSGRSQALKGLERLQKVQDIH
jgi:hypothetical protein